MKGPEGILADWKEMTCGSDLHQEIEGALTQAGIEHDWVDGMRKTIIEVRARSVPLAHAAGGIDITWRHLPAPHYADFE
ncbi:hypothetical protein [Sphingomonas sp. 3-13AW]|uniref:hypothetical protein n=1 Tax=Sphingomonas sp. 3-13AW TaxID=3050450 RepID=UPI003BB71594